MEKELCNVSDVYDHAAAIGKDIEYIINEYGKETIEDVMPKIVFVLEQLEGLAEQHEKDKEMIASLMLEREKYIIHSNRDQAIQRQLEEKLAYMESLVSRDKKELEQKLKTLETEHEFMMEELEKRDDEMLSKEKSNGALPGDIEVMMRMKTTIDNQRDQIRLQKHELQTQRSEVEGLAEQINRLGNINEELRSTSSPDSVGTKSSVEDHTHDSDSGVEPRLQESDTSLLDELKTEDASFNEQDTAHSSFTEICSTSICLTSDESTTLPSVDEQTKKKDPDRPRYTLKEMQSLLEERNMYKIQMMALDEELQLYKGGEDNLLKTQSQSAPVNVNNITPKQTGVRTFMQKFLGK